MMGGGGRRGSYWDWVGSGRLGIGRYCKFLGSQIVWFANNYVFNTIMFANIRLRIRGQ